MDKEKQIKEMVKDLLEAYAINKLYTEDVAEHLYNAGYRKVDEDYAIQCTCYALGCQQAEQIETKAKQEVAKQIFDKVKKRIHNEYNDLSNIVPTDDDYYLGKLAGISEAEIIIAELKKKHIGEKRCLK